MNFDKTKTASIALILMLTFSATILALPIVSAHEPAWTVPTWSYVNVTPNPVGVGQQAVVVFWCDKYPPTAVGAYGDRWTFNIEVTTPSGSKQNLGPITSDPVGTGWILFTPTEVGTYSFVSTMDDHLITGLPYPPGTRGLYRGPDYVNDTYTGSTSDPGYLTVQEDPITGWEESPIPTEYWTRPINSMNREWWQLAGNWLAGSAQNVGPTTSFGYGTAPESAHVMWSTPMWAGGIMDARFGDIGYETSHYEGLNFSPPIILNGKIYYNIESIPREGYRVLDLYTGEELWYHNQSGPIINQEGTQQLSGNAFDYTGRIANVILAFGQIYDYESPNQHGGFPYIWDTSSTAGTWKMYDAETGNYICSIANISSTGATRGTRVYGKDGSILYYNLDTNKDLLTCWNSSRAIWYREQYQTNQYWMWRPYLNYTFGAQYGFSLNATIPDVQGSLRCVREGEFIIGGTTGSNNEDGVVKGTLWALSLEEGKEGQLLWTYDFTPPSSAGNLTVSMGTVDPEDGVFLFESRQTRQRWGYDLATGQQLWESEPEEAFNYYGMSDNIYQGKLFSFGYGGELIAYSITTGDILWTYTASGVGFESPYGNYPLNLACVADGKIYLYSTEHSPTQPLWRGSYLRCIDTETGEEVWKISHWGNAVVADGFLVGLNYYDNKIYCYGKGPSQTTVTSAPKIVDWGRSVMIEGTVTDQSYGTKQIEQASRFPNGVPAVADAYQEDWMQYVYMQQGCPADAQGVEVVITTLDPNGNTYEIGRTTTGLSGTFGCAVNPPVPGTYKIIASFEGSDSYYGSYAVTYINVEEAPSAAQSMEPEPAAPAPVEPAATTEAPMITTEIAIIAALAVACIIGITSYWTLRKRK
jgi:hypothetical protein